MNRLRRRLRNRRLDRAERRMRQVTEGQCYMCALSGWEEEADRGQLCERHFNEVNWPPAMNYPDYM